MSILVIYQLNFSYNNNEILPRIIEIKYRSVNSKDVSCYKTVLNYIICFYQNSFYYYEAVAFDQNLNYVTYIDILNEPINKYKGYDVKWNGKDYTSEWFIKGAQLKHI